MALGAPYYLKRPQSPRGCVSIQVGKAFFLMPRGPKIKLNRKKKSLRRQTLGTTFTMGKKNKKSAEHKERVAAKQSKKSAKTEKKSKAKGKDADSDVEEADLDDILAQYAEEQAKFLKVTEVVSEPPAPRSSATVLASPSNRNELLLFGGEYYDENLATFFNNLFVYLIDRGEWREVTSPNSPLPRSGHAWCRGGNTGGVYLFGGKFGQTPIRICICIRFMHLV